MHSLGKPLGNMKGGLLRHYFIDFNETIRHYSADPVLSIIVLS